VWRREDAELCYGLSYRQRYWTGEDKKGRGELQQPKALGPSQCVERGSSLRESTLDSSFFACSPLSIFILFGFFETICNPG
jgi:hypothetical protein